MAGHRINLVLKDRNHGLISDYAAKQGTSVTGALNAIIEDFFQRNGGIPETFQSEEVQLLNAILCEMQAWRAER